MRKKVFILVFLILGSYLYSVEKDIKLTYNDLSLNLMLPGFSSLRKGNYLEAAFYASSMPIMLLGSFFVFQYQYADILGERVEGYEHSHINIGDLQIATEIKDGKTYLLNSTPRKGQKEKEYLNYIGNILSLYGMLIYSYSQYDTYYDINEDKFGETRVKYTLPELMLSPYDYKNVFNFEFFPMFPITILGGFADYNSIKNIGNYFNRDSVSVAGLNLKPLPALGVFTGLTLAFVTANATWEEIIFRGVMVDNSKKVSVMPLVFGSAHLPNMLQAEVSVEDTLFQTLFATLFGFYAEHQVRKDPANLKKMVALHFWHNVTAMVLSYLVSEGSGKEASLSIGVNCRF